MVVRVGKLVALKTAGNPWKNSCLLMQPAVHSTRMYDFQNASRNVSNIRCEHEPDFTGQGGDEGGESHLGRVVQEESA